MGKLADLAQAKKLKGRVSVTTLSGVTHLYENEAEAEAACAGMNLEHRRGAFFECGSGGKADDTVVLLDDDASVDDEPSRRTTKRKKKAKKKRSGFSSESS